MVPLTAAKNTKIYCIADGFCKEFAKNTDRELEASVDAISNAKQTGYCSFNLFLRVPP
jgi:hypothetical protein